MTKLLTFLGDELLLLLCRRLLSTDPEAAKEVVLAEKPVIADTSSNLEPALLNILLANLSTLSAVYHKPPEVHLPSKQRISGILCERLRHLEDRVIADVPLRVLTYKAEQWVMLPGTWRHALQSLQCFDSSVCSYMQHVYCPT